MSQALLAIASLLLGVALNEWIRRSNRLEAYAPSVFQKRFALYEELWKKIREGRDVAEELMQDSSLTAEQRHSVVSTIVLDVAQFCDENELYLNEEATVHCCTVFMGVEDVQPDKTAAEREKLIAHFRQRYGEAKEILRSEMGLKRMDDLFRQVTRAKYSSDVIEYYRLLQEEGRKDKKRLSAE